MKHFNQTLFIARSIESADLYLLEHAGAIKAITLGTLLSCEELTQSVPMDAMIGKMVLKQAIQSLNLNHFDYLSTAEVSLGEVCAHLLTCKRNRVGLEVFDYDPKKLSELQQIQNAYEALKNTMDLKDSADVLIEAVQSLRDTKYFNAYEKVVLDLFEEDSIRFYSNALEQEALTIIRSLLHVELLTPQNLPLKPIASYTPQPSRFDEALFAIKAARKLMEEGVSDTDIAIVTGNLGNYRQVLEHYAPSYEMMLRFSSGIPMMQSSLFSHFLKAKSFDHFKTTFSHRLKEDHAQGLIGMDKIEALKAHFTQIKRLHQRALNIIETSQKLFSITPSYQEILLSLAEETHIPPLKESAGIWVSEPNQMPNRYFKHLIFIGTDLSQFPPKSRNNFLSTTNQQERYLGLDNSYRLSQYYFIKMQKNSESLHLSTALQEGKKKLFLSPIITHLPQQPFASYQCTGERETLHCEARFVQDDSFEAYTAAALSSIPSAYDGNSALHHFKSGVLSASSLNQYTKCPLRYQLNYHYKAEPLAIDSDDDALEASDIGIIFHSIAEQFAKDVQSSIIHLGDEPTTGIKAHLQKIAIEKHRAYIQEHIIDEGKTPTIFHEIVLHDLIKGLFEEHHERGLLVRFLDYVYETGKLEHFEKSEKRFMLDDDFCITADKDKAMVKGFIDRIDKDAQHKILSIIDYKTGKYAKDKEETIIEEMGTFKQFQLPLYLLYASQAYSGYTIDAHLLSMRDGKGTKTYAHMSNDAHNGLHFDEGYAQGLKEKICSIKASIESGIFAMSPSEENCSYCPYERICHKDILGHKWAEEESVGDDDEQ